MQCQTTECTQALILSVTPSVTLTESLSVLFFHITIYIRHSVSLSTSHETDIIVYMFYVFILLKVGVSACLTFCVILLTILN